MGWNEDLALGKKFEIIYFENELLEENEIYQSIGKCSGWDIQTFSGVQYEVKACRRWKSTGNILVEFSCKSSQSGISTTTSDFWCFYQLAFNDDWIKCITVPVWVLKELIKNNKFHQTFYGAQYDKSNFYLFKESVFNEYKDLIKISKNQTHHKTEIA